MAIEKMENKSPQDASYWDTYEVNVCNLFFQLY